MGEALPILIVDNKQESTIREIPGILRKANPGRARVPDTFKVNESGGGGWNQREELITGASEKEIKSGGIRLSPIGYQES